VRDIGVYGLDFPDLQKMHCDSIEMIYLYTKKIKKEGV
jgi:hypothetical protein